MKKNKRITVTVGFLVLITSFINSFIVYLKNNFVVDFEMMLYTFFNGIGGADINIFLMEQKK